MFVPSRPDTKQCFSRTHHLICGHNIYSRINGYGRNCRFPLGPQSVNKLRCEKCLENDGAYSLLCEITRNDAIRPTLKKFGKMAYSDNIEREMKHREAEMKLKVPSRVWDKFVSEDRHAFKGWLTERLEKEFRLAPGRSDRNFEILVDPEAEKLRTELEIQQIALQNYLELSELTAIEVPNDLFADFDFQTTMDHLHANTLGQILELGTTNTRVAAVTEHYVFMYECPVISMSLGQLIQLGSAIRAMFHDLSHRRHPHSAEASPTLACERFLTVVETTAIDESDSNHSTQRQQSRENSCDNSSSLDGNADSSSDRSPLDKTPSPAEEEEIRSAEARNERVRGELLEKIYAMVGKSAPADKARRDTQVVPPRSESG